MKSKFFKFTFELSLLHGGKTKKNATHDKWRSTVNSVVHRDLKPENIGILRNTDGLVSFLSNRFKNRFFQFCGVIADFGMSSVLLKKQHHQRDKDTWNKLRDTVDERIFGKKVGFNADKLLVNILQSKENVSF